MIRIEVLNEKLGIIRQMSEKMEIGGRSNIYADTDERKSNLSTNQFISQLCVFAFNLYWFGDEKMWLIDRWYRNQNPYSGDGGYDVPGLNIDVKGSKLNDGKLPKDYHLAVRPKERHKGWTYVCAIAKDPNIEPKSETWIVYLMGWATDEMLTEIPNGVGVFDGSHTLEIKELYPLPPIRWKFC
jgi:hypothetical protein